MPKVYGEDTGGIGAQPAALPPRMVDSSRTSAGPWPPRRGRAGSVVRRLNESLAFHTSDPRLRPWRRLTVPHESCATYSRARRRAASSTAQEGSRRAPVGTTRGCGEPPPRGRDRGADRRAAPPRRLRARPGAAGPVAVRAAVTVVGDLGWAGPSPPTTRCRAAGRSGSSSPARARRSPRSRHRRMVPPRPPGIHPSAPGSSASALSGLDGGHVVDGRHPPELVERSSISSRVSVWTRSVPNSSTLKEASTEP